MVVDDAEDHLTQGALRAHLVQGFLEELRDSLRRVLERPAPEGTEDQHIAIQLDRSLDDDLDLLPHGILVSPVL
eukprot:9093620-Alexandrium_andersonii.AAC.1